MTTWSHDGHPLQAGTSRSDYSLTGERAHFSIFDIREMVVIARYYVDDPNNRSKRYVEYTCRDIHTSETYPFCRQLSAMSGMTDGDDNVLKPATTFVPGALGANGGLVTEQTPAKDVDGDQVLVGFISGSRSRPVIVSVFRHSASQYGAKTADGERRLTTHKGTTVEIKSDGTYVITHKSGAYIRLDPDGSIDVVPAGQGKVHEGDPAAVDAAVRGTTYRSAEDARFAAMDTLAEALAAAVSALSTASPTLTGPPPAQGAWAAAVTAVTAALTAYTTAVSAFSAGSANYLSNKVTVSV